MPTFEFRNYDKVIDVVSSNFKNSEVLVIGDVMLDTYIWGEVTRISPEAPVPVVKQIRKTLVAGGAGNVAANLAGLGLNVKLIGLIGSDVAAKLMQDELIRMGIDVRGIIVDTTRPTTTKMRIIGGHQQMLRLDQESSNWISGSIENALVSEIVENICTATSVILSDYAKGTLTPLVCQTAIKEARRKGIPILVDPKGADWQKYRGATCITPNRSEMISVVGHGFSSKIAIQKTAEELCERYALDAITVTLSEDGMLHVKRKFCIHVPTMAREVFDVSGAGDTAIATLTASLATKLEDQDALILANIAAGIVVGKVGTKSIERKELLSFLKNNNNFREQ